MTDILPAIDTRRTALLVMDFQAGALGAISEAEALLARVADAIAIVRARDGHIGYVRTGFHDTTIEEWPAAPERMPLCVKEFRLSHAA